MTRPKIDLTISIVNHSNPDMLRDCLASLFASARNLSVEVWVIDNATDGRGVAQMREEFPQVRWLFNETRQGFAANHNLVLRQAQSRYACILNDDTLIHPGAFDRLVGYMDQNRSVGMAGAKLLNADGTLQNCTFRFFTLMSTLVEISLLPGPLCALKQWWVDGAQNQNEPQLVDWVLGACIVVRKETLERIGPLDSETFPIANNEEVDWCFRSWKAGWPVAFVPAATITHFGGQSMKTPSGEPDRMRIELMRTRISFFRKNYGFLQALLLRLILVGTLPWNALMLGQALMRKTTEPAQCRTNWFTLYRVARIALRP